MPRSAIRLMTVTPAGAMIVLLQVLPAAAEPLSAAAFSAGQTVCFELGDHKDGAFQHLKLVFEPAPGDGSYPVIPVHGIERGTWQSGAASGVYVNEFAGTGTVAPSAQPASTDSRLFITLTGGGNGYKSDGSAELWTIQYALDLDPATLEGRIYGVAIESGTLVNGDPYRSMNANNIVKEVTPSSCAEFGEP